MATSKMLNSWVGKAFHRLAPTTANLFRTFTPHLPMGIPGTSRRERLIDLDVPVKLQQQLDAQHFMCSFGKAFLLAEVV